MIKLKKLLNRFLAAFVILSSFFAYFITTTLARGDEGVYEKLSDLFGVPEKFVKAGNNIFYTARGNLGITELHVTDGTDEGTVLLRIFGGEDNVAIYSNLITLGDNVYFTAYTPDTGSELWVSDGTTEGTHILKDIYPGSADGAHGPLYVMGDKLYFTGADGTHGFELWISDGTTEGTHLLKDASGGTGSDIRFIKDFGGYLYYNYINLNTAVNQLWRTDGTATGTTMIKDNFASTDASYATVYNNELYFLGSTDETGWELWKTDGTTEGTTMLKDINEGTESSNPTDLIVFKDKLYFAAETILSYDEEREEYDTGYRVFATNGTEEGTVIAHEFNDAGVYSIPNPVVLKNILYFTYNDNEHGNELWRSDGTKEGTYMLKDIIPGNYGSEPSMKQVINNKIYFIVGNDYTLDDEYYSELWISDGTTEGTKRLKTHLGYVMGYMDMYNFEDSIYYQQAKDTIDVEGGYFWGVDLELWKYTPPSPKSNYTVTFKNHDGNVLKIEIVDDGNSATAPITPVREGYTFTGWDKEFSSVTDNLTITAKYSINTYNVTFEDYDGTVLKSQTVNHGSSATAPENPIREGYTFKGWDNNYSNITDNIIVTAIYEVIELNTTEEKPELVIDDLTNSISTEDLNTIKNNIKVYNENNELIGLYDINLMINGVKVQPNGYIDIRIPMTDKHKEYENLKVIYIDDNKEITFLPHTIDGDYIVFSVNHLSNYAVIGTKMVKKTATDTTNIADNKTSSSGLFTRISNHPFIFGSIAVLALGTIIIIIKKKRKKSKKRRRKR